MQGQGSGSIINISSTYGHEGAAGASVYVGSKHAVEGITKSVALEVAKSGIRVNGVAPGPTDTGMLTRFTGTPETRLQVHGVVLGFRHYPSPLPDWLTEPTIARPPEGTCTCSTVIFCWPLPRWRLSVSSNIAKVRESFPAWFRYSRRKDDVTLLFKASRS
jgi:NAD(P)-dependent dehydrogenase (short-subunit alcohol dehydrogenase family)